jgi:hypothetical protein
MLDSTRRCRIAATVASSLRRIQPAGLPILSSHPIIQPRFAAESEKLLG